MSFLRKPFYLGVLSGVVVYLAFTTAAEFQARTACESKGGTTVKTSAYNFVCAKLEIIKT